MSKPLNTAEHIRMTIFGCRTQTEFAQLLDVSQASVSRWEKIGAVSKVAMPVIRSIAKKKGKHWNDAWFFDAPKNVRGAKA